MTNPAPKARLTPKQAQRALDWFIKVAGIADWTITVNMDKHPPSDMGEGGDSLGKCATARPYKAATIWLNLPEHGNDYDPIGTLFHEGMHVVAADLEYADCLTGEAEFLWNKLGDILAKAYRAGVKP